MFDVWEENDELFELMFDVWEENNNHNIGAQQWPQQWHNIAKEYTTMTHLEIPPHDSNR